MIIVQQTGFRDTNIYENKFDKCFTVSLHESLPVFDLILLEIIPITFLSTNKF